MILLDTHALIWMAAGAPELGPASLRLIDAAASRGELAVCAISFWECAQLVARKRIVLPAPVLEWRADLLASNVAELPLDGGMAIRSVTLPWTHKNPADRFIVASAIAHQATLITADTAILRWRNELPRHDARH